MSAEHSAHVDQRSGTGSWHPWCSCCGWSGRYYRAKTEAEEVAHRHSRRTDGAVSAQTTPQDGSTSP